MATVKEAAEQLGISERAVIKRLMAGTLPSSKQGKQWTVELPAIKDSEPVSEPRSELPELSSEPKRTPQWRFFRRS
jgi:excisionase family DNA binding protein